jgi:2-C-methyl-D-erythritol 4-phosphate cytidylyltransferase
LKKYVIIVAAGRGKRMHSETPKQFLNVAGKPLLMHTVNAFADYPDDIGIKLVLSGPFLDFWQSLCKRFDFNVPHELIEGGEVRFQSVRNGLANIENNRLVAVHDGVRPLVSQETIQRVFQVAEEKGNAVPVVKINESIRHLNKEQHSHPVNRQHFRLVQTPQCFRSELLIKAYQQEYRKEFTDDATVLEAMGAQINLVEGNFENIKITRPADLKMASAFLK